MSSHESPAALFDVRWRAFEHAFSNAVSIDAAAIASASGKGVVVATFAVEPWRDYRSQAAAMLDVAERQRAQRQRDPRDRDVLTLTYALHRLLLSRVMDCAPDRVPVYRDDKGCPRVRAAALWTSLSHARERVALAVSGVGPVGIDLEPSSRAADMAEIIDRVAHPQEMIGLLAMPAEARWRALLALWVRKEAVLKAAGIGLECEMEAFVVADGGALPLPGGRVAEQETQVSMLEAVSGWTIAVARPVGMDVCLATRA